MLLDERVTVWTNLQGRSRPAGGRETHGWWRAGVLGSKLQEVRACGQGARLPPSCLLPRGRGEEGRAEPHPRSLLHDNGPSGLLCLVSTLRRKAEPALGERPLQTGPPAPRTQPLSVTDGTGSARSLLAAPQSNRGGVGLASGSAARQRCLLMPRGGRDLVGNSQEEGRLRSPVRTPSSQGRDRSPQATATYRWGPGGPGSEKDVPGPSAGAPGPSEGVMASPKPQPAPSTRSMGSHPALTTHTGPHPTRRVDKCSHRRPRSMPAPPP